MSTTAVSPKQKVGIYTEEQAAGLANQVGSLLAPRLQLLVATAVRNSLSPSIDGLLSDLERKKRSVTDEWRASLVELERKTKGRFDAEANSFVSNVRLKMEDAAAAAAETLNGIRDTVVRSQAEIKAAIMGEVRKMVADQSTQLVRHVHVIKSGPKERTLPEGQVYHKAFGEIIDLIGCGFNVFAPGPSGSGKTYLARQIADALKLRFGMVSGTAGTTENEFLGTSVPNISTGKNEYEDTEFLDLYENGGLFLLDEGDAMDPNCLLKINAAIANGYCAVPKRKAKRRAERHEKFVFMLAANTWGSGATRMYCGRNRLDESTLDRFRCGTVPVDYDEGVELWCVNQDLELFEMLRGWREKIVQAKLQRILSTRFMEGAYILKHVLKKDSAYIAKKLVSGWSDHEAQMVVGDLAKV